MCLEDQIWDRFARSKFGNEKEEYYLPEGCLDELITGTAIEGKLKISAAVSEQKLLVDFIKQKAKKVFAITILANLRDDELCHAMRQFQKHDFTDDFLPISKLKANVTVSIQDAFSDNRLWTSWRKHLFEEKQWMFLVPVFTEHQFMYRFERDCILPFQSVNSQVKEGTFGDVFEVEVHESHRKGDVFMVNGKRANVAVKEIVARETGESTLDDVNRAYEIEATALKKTSEVKHENLIRCAAAITRGEKRYFLFPWADGGSLREFWKSVPNPTLTPETVRNVVKQICGLAEALDSMHSYEGEAAFSRQVTELGNANIEADLGVAHKAALGSGGIRHGDLKPENILRFVSGDSKEIGTLKIADMGLAKHHEVNTMLRKNPTSTKYGTARYKPPQMEALRFTSLATSRLYDTWSMGCIILELIIWLLYGYVELVEFYHSTADSYVMENVGQGKAAEVRPFVTAYIAHMSEDKACAPGTALGDLLEIIKTKLLVVQLPPSSITPINANVSITPAPTTKPNTGQHRATASVLCDSLKDILGKAQDDDGHLYAGRDRKWIGGLSSMLQRASPGGLHPDSAQKLGERYREASTMETLPAPATQMREDLDIKVWDFTVDNDLATRVLEKFDESSGPSPFPKPTIPEQLCDDCHGLDFWAPQFRMLDKLAELRIRAAACRFCRMRWEACNHLEGVTDTVRFDRVESVIKMNESDPPVFSICRCRDLQTPVPIQIGLPTLPEAGSNVHFATIQCWLKDCNDKHANLKCTTRTTDDSPILPTGMEHFRTAVLREMQARKLLRLPTRLINVGTQDFPTLQLYKTQPDDKSEDFDYVALSHRCGDPDPYKGYFCTTKDNEEAFLKQIDTKDLPETFKDAFITTRALGIRYLWIDSLCIVQGIGGDFISESKRMEDVFSSAYCVIAASCATGQWDGFLKARSSPQRDYVTFQRRSDPPFYVCRFIDDFNHDILEGLLSQRGWVLQERALARRTIYFSRGQTYWECGGGVRCETLTRMYNQLNAFLGDPNFPDAAIRSSRSKRETSRGEKILYYQDLYMRYSRLAFSRWEDRAVAMQGMEQRLIRGFKARGGFGVLDDKTGFSHRSLLHRSLLWHRGADESSLKRISFPPDRQKAPTWSWMAYQGGIDYLQIPFDGVEWESADLQSPWQTTEVRTADRAEITELGAIARDLAIGNSKSEDMEVIFDVTGRTGGPSPSVMCIVVGRAKEKAAIEGRLHYILLVTPKASLGVTGAPVFERIGAGRVPGRCIGFGRPGLAVRIR